jgi:hypothetical protein
MSLHFIELFPPEHVTMIIEPDKEYRLHTTLPEQMLFTENWQIPNMNLDYSNKLVIRNSGGYISENNEIDFLLKNREIIEKNIIFDRAGLYKKLEDFSNTTIYKDQLIIYNKINSDNFLLKILNSICYLYCDENLLCILDYASPVLNYYLKLYYKNPENNCFNVSVDFIPKIKKFIVVSNPIGFDKEKLLIFSLHYFYDNIYVSYSEIIANISLCDMNEFVRDHYLKLLNKSVFELPIDDMTVVSRNIYGQSIEKFYNIQDIISNRCL